MSQIIHVGALDAPKVISRVGSVQNLVDHVLQPIVGNYFRNSAQASTVLDFLTARSERQAEAAHHIRAALGAYDVQAIDTLIGDITPPAELMRTQTDRKIAEEQRKTYEVQQAAQAERQKLVRETAVADIQQEVVKTEQGVTMAELRANAQIKQAIGEAEAMRLRAGGESEATRLKAGGEAEAIRATGEAKAEAYQAGVEALGGHGFRIGRFRPAGLTGACRAHVRFRTVAPRKAEQRRGHDRSVIISPSVDEPEREPCFHCAEPAALEAKLCPRCHRSLLVSVVAEPPLPEERAVYQAARALAALGPPAPSFLELRSALGAPSPVVVRSATRAFAREAIAALDANGVKARERAEPETAGAAKTHRGPLWPGLAALLVGVVALGAWELRRRQPEPAAAGERARPENRTPDPVRAPMSSRSLTGTLTSSTVSIRCNQSVGTGFFVDREIILTNAHVVCPEGDEMKVVLAGGGEFAGTTMRKDDWLDLALVNVSGAGAKPLPIGDALGLEAGDKVVMMGSPKGLEFTVQEGIVSHPGRNVLGLAYVQLGIHINPGNSGGPVVDDLGRVVGIASMAVTDSSGLGLALPINYAYEGYAGGRPFVPRPEGTGDRSRWTALLARVADEDRQAVARQSHGSTHPGLVKAAFVPGVGIVALVGRFATSAPGLESFDFKVEDMCTGRGSVQTWRQVEMKKDAADSRYVQWLERHGLLQKLYAGPATLELTECPPLEAMIGGVLQLEGAEENATRALIGVEMMPPQ